MSISQRISIYDHYLARKGAKAPFRNDFDLAILDIEMPLLNEFQAAERFRNLNVNGQRLLSNETLE